MASTGDASVAGRTLSTSTYTGDVYSPDFVGPVQWRYLYRGDSTLRTTFDSAMTNDLGRGASSDYLSSLSDGTLRDVMEEHGVTSQNTPFISTSSNPRVAEYYARGTEQNQQGWVTTFRLSPADADAFAIPNFENPVAFFAENSKIGMPESEYIFANSINPKFIFKQEIGRAHV